MVTALTLLGVVLVLFVAAVLSTREGPVLADAAQDAADLALPEGPLTPEDLRGVRFGLAPRGYRMSEVDAVLERLGAELADRDRRLALLDATVEGESVVREATEADLPVESAPIPVPPAAPSTETAGVESAHDVEPAPAPEEPGYPDLPPVVPAEPLAPTTPVSPPWEPGPSEPAEPAQPLPTVSTPDASAGGPATPPRD